MSVRKTLPVVIVSTVDGKVAAYKNDDQILWASKVHHDALFESYKLSGFLYDGKKCQLVPSLSSHLFIKEDSFSFTLLPLSTQNMLCNDSFCLDVIITGKHESVTYGINMESGEILFKYSSDSPSKPNKVNAECPIIVITYFIRTIKAYLKISGNLSWSFRTSTVESRLLNTAKSHVPEAGIDKITYNFFDGNMVTLTDPNGFRHQTQVLNSWRVKKNEFVPLDWNMIHQNKKFGLLMTECKEYVFIVESEELKTSIDNLESPEKVTFSFAVTFFTKNFTYYYNCLKHDMLRFPSSRTQYSVKFNSNFETQYEILGSLGRGGFGMVYKAKHKLDKKECAIKRIVIKPGTEKRTLREVESLAQLEHKNIVRYFESWKETHDITWQQNFDQKWLGGGSLYDDSISTETSDTKNSSEKVYLFITMEFCNEGDLSDWLKKKFKGTRNFRKVINVLTQIFSAVKYIHGNSLIHRDLKPKNIFFRSGVVKVGDFGLVTTMNINNVLVDGIYSYANGDGTRLYMSPEQIGKKKINAQVDIYALGIILFEMLVPFQTEYERVKTITSLRNNIYPKDFLDMYIEEKQLIEKMLSIEPTARPDIKTLYSWASEMKNKLNKEQTSVKTV